MGTSEEMAFQILEALGVEKRASYVCVPITTGRRELFLARNLGVAPGKVRELGPVAWRARVLQPNLADAKAFASRIRGLEAPASLVLDPSRVHVQGWGQDRYGSLWREVITRFMAKLILAPDWQFSRGCRIEVNLGLRLGLLIADHDLKPLGHDDLMALDSEVRTYLRSEGFSDAEMEDYLPSIA